MHTVHQSASAPAAPFPVTAARREFPALEQPVVFFDNAAGAQVPQAVLDRVREHLVACNVQRGGRYPMSRSVDAMIAAARASIADFLHAAGPAEISFGLNGTSFLRLVSQGIGQDLNTRREIVVTETDHEANIAPWLALERTGAVLRWWRADAGGRLQLADLEPLLSPRTRVVACAAASNATGTIVDLAAVASRAHAAGAELVVDAVHYGPHGPLDVQAIGCDYLACSGYKIFGPHMGFLWGRLSALERLATFREAFIPDRPPDKIEAGTFAYENVAGMDAAIGYLEALGRHIPGAAVGSRWERLHAVMAAVKEYEAGLSGRLLRGLHDVGAVVYGIRDAAEVADRVPTLLFNLPGQPPSRVVEALAVSGIAARDGHMYAPRLMRRLNLSEDSGAVRVSLVHYNTAGEIDRLCEFLSRLRSH